MEQRELEGFVRGSLERQASRISPTPGYTQRIKDQLRLHQQVKRGGLFALHGYSSYRPTWRQAATVACCAVLVLALLFSLSVPARTWATDTFLKVFKISRNSAGYQVSPADPSSPGSVTIQGHQAGTVPIPTVPASTSVNVVVTSTQKAPEGAVFAAPEDARAKLGLAFYLPNYVPDGYKLVVMSGQQHPLKINGKEGSYKVANAVYTGEGNKQLLLYVTDFKDFLAAADGVQTVDLRGYTGLWSEYPVVTYSGTDQTAAAGHQLRWEENGNYYVLTNDKADLSLSEMVKIAESIAIK